MLVKVGWVAKEEDMKAQSMTGTAIVNNEGMFRC